MGCGASESKSGAEERTRSTKINKLLHKYDEIESAIVKLLLLGAGDSGKSTILKQMQIIHSDGFNRKEDTLPYKPIYTNLINTISMICNGAKKFQIEFSHPEIEATASEFTKETVDFNMAMPFDGDFFKRVEALCSDPAVAQVFEHRNQLQIEDSAFYFLKSLDRLQQSDYIPSVEDILRARASTTGIVEVSFQSEAATFKVIDVGGQKSERRKWMHCFDTVTTVIFIVAINEYDRTLREDGTTNRMTDALELFHSIANVRWFVDKDMILFLNKIDLFREKIGTISIRVRFPQYTGNDDYESCLEFVRRIFMAENTNRQRTIAAHATCATDTTQVKKVIENVIGTLVDKFQRV